MPLRSFHAGESRTSDTNFKIRQIFEWYILFLRLTARLSNDLWATFFTTVCYFQGNVPQLSIMIIYNSKWSILIQWFNVMIVSWQCDLVNTTENVFPVCDKPYHTNKWNVQNRKEIAVLRKCVAYLILITKGIIIRRYVYFKMFILLLKFNNSKTLLNKYFSTSRLELTYYKTLYLSIIMKKHLYIWKTRTLEHF